MTIPVIGFVSIPDVLLAIYFLVMLAGGLMRGLGRELPLFVCAIAALLIAIAAPVHNQAVEWLYFLEHNLADATAYAAVFCLVVSILRMLAFQVPALRELKFQGFFGCILGGILGLARAVLNITICLLLAAAWKLPWEVLFNESEIAEFIAGLWYKLGMFPMLYTNFHVF
jgi:uncharacterized membrane protein required for colicin V production